MFIQRIKGRARREVENAKPLKIANMSHLKHFIYNTRGSKGEVKYSILSTHGLGANRMVAGRSRQREGLSKDGNETVKRKSLCLSYGVLVGQDLIDGVHPGRHGEQTDLITIAR